MARPTTHQPPQVTFGTLQQRPANGHQAQGTRERVDASTGVSEIVRRRNHARIISAIHLRQITVVRRHG